MPGASVLHYLQQGDAVTRAVAGLLILMSLASWCCLLARLWMLLRTRRQAPLAVAAFWHAADVATGIDAIARADGERIFAPLANAAWHAAAANASHADAGGRAVTGILASIDRNERVLRALRGALLASQRRLEAGQVLLASIGATAPFVGLLGTVWGIYHALQSIAVSGRSSIGAVAGPVGEALIMTALGLVVAIPAVLAYNALGRVARGIGEELDGFAHDLHAYFGAPAVHGAAASDVHAGSRRAPAQD